MENVYELRYLKFLRKLHRSKLVCDYQLLNDSITQRHSCEFLYVYLMRDDYYPPASYKGCYIAFRTKIP